MPVGAGMMFTATGCSSEMVGGPCWFFEFRIFLRGILMPWYSEALSFTSPVPFCVEVLLVLRLHPRMTSKADPETSPRHVRE